MVWIVPSAELELAKKVGARDAAERLLLDAIKARGKKPENYVVRDILPKTDLGLANEEWKISYASAYAWEAKVDITLPDDKFVAFYGYQNNSAAPKTLAVKFYKDKIPIEVVQVECLYTYAEPVGFFTPMCWSESDGLKIEFYGNAAGDDYPVLRGLTAELRRKTIA
jgi:hypothetical protein